MEDSFHYMLMANQAMVQKKLLAGLKETGLTIGQPKVLEYLRGHEGAGQKEIARACYIEPGSLTVLLNRMEEQKMLERRMKDGNRRSLYVYLTPYGKTLAEQVVQSFAELEEKAFCGIPEEKREELMQLFSLVNQNLQREEQQA